MKYYDIIIIGAGIAGCGLAYNLRRIGYEGSILIIDKERIGANEGYGIRNTFKSVIDEYGLLYEHKYKGLICGDFDKIIATLDNDFYSIDYKKTCECLLSKCSDVVFRKELAREVQKKRLITDRKEYFFEYLIDCSGYSFFLKNILKHAKPSKYWIGHVNILYNKIEDDEYYYHFVNNDGFLEDIYPTKKFSMQGIWRYSDEINPNLINYSGNLCSDRIIKSKKIKKNHFGVIPCSPAFPIVIGNCALLGDSFGNASASSGEGIRHILDTSKILATSIKNKNLKSYEDKWKNIYLNQYIIQLSTKINYETRINLFNVLKNHQDILLQIIKNEKPSIKDIAKIIPLKLKLKLIKNYMILKIKFFYNGFL